MLREELRDSGLFVEGTEAFTRDAVVRSFYGFNVSKTPREPIDQIHAFLMAKRIQDSNLSRYGHPGEFCPFIAGMFEILNATSVSEMYHILATNREKDERKKQLFQRIMDCFGIQGRIHTTEDLWRDEAYWAIVEELFDELVFTEDQLARDAFKIYRSAKRLAKVIKVADIPSPLIDLSFKLRQKIGHWPAAMLYTPAEVAEAVFFARQMGINAKLGPVKEQLYDKYIKSFMDVIHLRQPVSLLSRRLKPHTVSPYADGYRSGRRETRVFFDDTAASMREKIRDLELEEYALAPEPEVGGVFNPLLQLSVYVAEAARCLGKSPVVLAGAAVHSGSDVLSSFEQGMYTIRQLADEIVPLVETFIIAPLREQ